MPQEIYRIEKLDKPKIGAYHSGATLDYYAAAPRCFYDHPEPDEEGFHLHPWQHCGFASLEQYRNWFPSTTGRAAMFRAGVHLRVYTVSRATVTPKQALFSFDDVISVREATPEEY